MNIYPGLKEPNPFDFLKMSDEEAQNAMDNYYENLKIAEKQEGEIRTSLGSFQKQKVKVP